MDITVYLPDEIGTQAKEAGMNLSRTLRDAVESELEHTRAMKELAGEAEEHLLDLETSDGQPFEGRVMGTLLCENRKGDQVFVTEDERVIVYYPYQSQYHVLENNEDALRETLGNLCDFDEYISAMSQLGYTAMVDL